MKTIFRLSTILALILIILCAPALSGTVKKTSEVMGTELEIILPSDSEAEAQKALSIVKAEFERIEAMMSEWVEGSPVSLINEKAGIAPVKAPLELLRVIDSSLVISSLTGGAFDITWASMKGLWRFKKGEERVPEPEEVKKAISKVGFRSVSIDKDKGTVFIKRQGTAIGLGGIAKGYAVDKASEALVKAGIKDFIVRAGGDMRVQGLNGGKPWEVGIKDPRDKDTMFARLPLTNISISTSGDYERFFIRDGRLYHHIIDPRTGYPAEGVRSVTIIASDTTTTDALSTAVFVLGPEKGLELIKKLGGVEAVIMDGKGAVSASKGVELKR